MRKTLLVATVLGAAMLGAQANALSITNEDPETHTVELVGSDGLTERFSLTYGDVREDLCGGGCTIRLDTGTQEDFEGSEGVTIRDGGFLMGE